MFGILQPELHTLSLYFRYASACILGVPQPVLQVCLSQYFVCPSACTSGVLQPVLGCASASTLGVPQPVLRVCLNLYLGCVSAYTQGVPQPVPPEAGPPDNKNLFFILPTTPPPSSSSPKQHQTMFCWSPEVVHPSLHSRDLQYVPITLKSTITTCEAQCHLPLAYSLYSCDCESTCEDVHYL